MTTEPLVTVVTPSYNQGSFIRDTIESVRAQDYPNIEHIVIDGGSTDDTLDILRSYGDQLAWISEPDNGQSEAINKGFHQAQGEILTWLNSDDTFLPGAVSESITFLQANPAIDLVYGDAQIIDEAGNVVFAHMKSKPFAVPTILTRFSAFTQPAGFFRKSALDRAGYLNETLHYVMDFDLWIRIGLNGQGAYLPGVRAQMRFHATSKSVTAETRFWAEKRHALDTLFARQDLPAEVRAARREAYAHCELYWGDNLLREGKQAEARPHLSFAFKTHPRPRRRLLALLLLIDSYAGTQLGTAVRKVRDQVEGAPQVWKPDV
ncbi:MAG: glycosyltransferase [Anaerolineae bacterium]|nr:glycosyltransferase [Anaerolineae bacterium]